MILGSILVHTRYMHGAVQLIFFREMVVVDREFSCVASYVDCGCTTAYYTHLLNVSGQKVVGEFSNRGKEIKRYKYSYEACEEVGK